MISLPMSITNDGLSHVDVTLTATLTWTALRVSLGLCVNVGSGALTRWSRQRGLTHIDVVLGVDVVPARRGMTLGGWLARHG